MSGDPALVWLDLETTGLDPELDRILEIGVIVTDEDLATLSVHRRVLAIDAIGAERLAANDFVREMHLRSGLIAECELSTLTLGQATAELIEILPRDLPMAGATVGFDRSFLRAHARPLHDVFHYRNFDVSTFRVALQMWGFDVPPKSEAHRAIPDLHESIALAKRMRNLLLAVAR